jgi:hypothetical protein
MMRKLAAEGLRCAGWLCRFVSGLFLTLAKGVFAAADYVEGRSL